LTQNNSSKASKWANFLVFAASLVPVILLLFVFSQRIAYPFDIEWAEGTALNQVFRILSNERIYSQPSLTFAPLVYTPLYYYVSAGISRLIEPGFFALRLVSVLSVVGASFLIYWIVLKQTLNHLSSWLAACLYLGCYDLAGGYYDLARVDSFFILIVLLALFVFIYEKSNLSKILVGILIAAAFFVKQTAIVLFFPILIIINLLDFKKYWPMFVSAVIGIAVPWILIDLSTEGYFSYYIYNLPRQHGLSILSAINFWIGDTIRPLGITFGLIILYLLIYIDAKQMERLAEEDTSATNRNRLQIIQIKNPVIKILLFSICAVGVSWVTRSTNGGGSNNVMLAYVSLALCFGLGFDRLTTYFNNRLKGKASLLPLIVPAVVTLQFIGLIYNPFKYVPNKTDFYINGVLVDELNQEENFLIPFRSHFNPTLGRNMKIHIINLFEFTGYFKGDILPEGIILVEELKNNICDQDYGIIVLDQPIPWIEEQVRAAYEEVDLAMGENGLIVGRQSSATEWQQGFWNVYKPKQETIAVCP
jgi:4-amino-4-deoxy-L-arabinose transferase-like glycosyltransferase